MTKITIINNKTLKVISTINDVENNITDSHTIAEKLGTIVHTEKLNKVYEKYWVDVK